MNIYSILYQKKKNYEKNLTIGFDYHLGRLSNFIKHELVNIIITIITSGKNKEISEDNVEFVHLKKLEKYSVT